MATIELQNIAHSYDGGETFALKEISMTWEDGKAYALLGPSGCGKTTLLNIMSGIIKPSHGRILIDGVDITDKPTEERNIAQVFQFPVLYDTMSVRKNLEFPLKNRKVPADKIQQRVAHIAELLGLEDQLDIRPGKLRSDLQQIVSLGRGLVREDVAAILFDEPLTVIDQNFKWTLRNRLKRLHLATGVTLVYVTHDQTEALTFADDVLLMKDGEVVQVGSANDLFLEPSHEFSGYFIGSPGMNFLDAEVSNHEVVAHGVHLGPVADTSLSGPHRVGVRPEFVVPVEKGGIDMDVVKVENRGGFQLAQLALADQKIMAKLDADLEISAGERRAFGFVPERTFLFHDERAVSTMKPMSAGAAR
ncbi:ABC transporter ATP-binding protein [Pontimonas sp.]|jgi:glycerol transport system ATP-binding protein|uniref:ABC transporter ATP-binding protein n=1 Tax=Pontimonas sp. TaxID=2304492 RepID=UPI0028702713|nr:ABC transporter ATP-binding protein [Pontimonas sp.]MDR9397015.1 ABC transporter ATP-binding protein [Pontimonas sp.]MDR9434496.1 ABC transporter ATP-binding protein [Pontimonas sp.]